LVAVFKAGQFSHAHAAVCFFCFPIKNEICQRSALRNKFRKTKAADTGSGLFRRGARFHCRPINGHTPRKLPVRNSNLPLHRFALAHAKGFIAYQAL
jgi:hypothetical protein